MPQMTIYDVPKPPSVMHFYSGRLMQLYSGVDTIDEERRVVQVLRVWNAAHDPEQFGV
jgi:hypothetical protein